MIGRSVTHHPDHPAKVRAPHVVECQPETVPGYPQFRQNTAPFHTACGARLATLKSLWETRPVYDDHPEAYPWLYHFLPTSNPTPGSPGFGSGESTASAKSYAAGSVDRPKTPRPTRRATRSGRSAEAAYWMWFRWRRTNRSPAATRRRGSIGTKSESRSDRNAGRPTNTPEGVTPWARNITTGRGLSRMATDRVPGRRLRLPERIILPRRPGRPFKNRAPNGGSAITPGRANTPAKSPVS
jgi:hypothetical protein